MNFTKTYKTQEGFTGGQKGTTESTEYVVLVFFVISNFVIFVEVIPIKKFQFMNLDSVTPKFIWKNELSKNSQEKKKKI